MSFRLSSLKTRTALAMTAVIVVVLAANAVFLILTGTRKLREGIAERAELFALLATKPICMAWENYHQSGVHKLRSLMRDFLQLGQDIERIRIHDVGGHVVFDTAEPEAPGLPPERPVDEPALLEAVRRLDLTRIPRRDPSGREALEIVVPYVEDWGRHGLSVSYHVTYENLRPQVVRQLYTTGGLALVSILLSLAVGATLATRITRPLEELTVGARHIADGQFDRRLDLRAGDEIQLLARTFNHMAQRLKENVEQLEESNRRLAAANENLKELDRMKSDLLANVSHELRTPLTAVKGYTDYMLEGKLGPVSDRQEKGLIVVQRNLERLGRTINALLDFSRLEMDGARLNVQPFDLAAVVDSIVAALRSELDKKSIGLGAEISPGLPPLIGDRDRIAQVLENLVINALKFTAPGGRITILAGRDPKSPRPAARVVVTDTGIGIPVDQIGKIFDRFHQVDGTTTRRFGGVGLGLSIVRSLLEAHGTAIEVESREGEGTSFRFTLPILDRTGAEAAVERGGS